MIKLVWFENHTMQAPADHIEARSASVKEAIYLVAKPDLRSLRYARGFAAYCEPSPTRTSAGRPLRIAKFPDRYQGQHRSQTDLGPGINSRDRLHSRDRRSR